VTPTAIPNDRVVVITGASSGVGRAAARAFAAQGARLVLAARSPVSLEATRAECLAEGGQAFVVPTDVLDGRAVDSIFEAAVERYGRVDAVVQSAAVVSYGRFDEVPADVFDHVMATNLTGTANVSRAALRLFRSQGGGSLVLVGSLLGKIAVPFMGSYVTSKWAVHGLARVLQLEARETPGIHISMVWPGSVNTPAYTQAANYTGWEGRPPPPVDPPEKMARAIVRAVDHPRRELSMGPANHFAVFGFRALPALYDVLVTPLMRVGGLSQRRLEPHTGNVFEPRPGGDAPRGPWGRLGLRTVHPTAQTSQTQDRGSEMADTWGLEGSAVVTHRVSAPPEAVWAVLADGWLYATWVVGASRIRDVDPTWPQEGSRAHHSFGLWPAVIDDTTEVLYSDPLRELVLKARGWPIGEAHVRLVLTGDGADGTEVSIQEDAANGPGQLLPRPARQAVVVPRNRESLRRLGFLAEGRHHGSSAGS
jgi:NAD(P)-dependent dehydrogenase (short-subunit alcohol dehydrogenase family)